MPQNSLCNILSFDRKYHHILNVRQHVLSGIINLQEVWRGLDKGLPARCSVRKSHWLFLRALATLPLKSAAAACTVRGSERLENVPVAHFQRRTGRQALGRNFCEAELAPREQKYIPCAFAAWGSQRPENRPVACFQRERAGRPWKAKGREAKALGGSRSGVLRAWKTVRWTVFTEERAGRPWLCPPIEPLRRRLSPLA